MYEKKPTAHWTDYSMIYGPQYQWEWATRATKTSSLVAINHNFRNNRNYTDSLPLTYVEKTPLVTKQCVSCCSCPIPRCKFIRHHCRYWRKKKEEGRREEEGRRRNQISRILVNFWMIGVHRLLSVEALRDGIRTHAFWNFWKRSRLFQSDIDNSSYWQKTEDEKFDSWKLKFGIHWISQEPDNHSRFWSGSPLDDIKTESSTGRSNFTSK